MLNHLLLQIYELFLKIPNFYAKNPCKFLFFKKFAVSLSPLNDAKHYVNFVLKSEGVSSFGTPCMLYLHQKREFSVYKLWERY